MFSISSLGLLLAVQTKLSLTEEEKLNFEHINDNVYHPQQNNCDHNACSMLHGSSSTNKATNTHLCASYTLLNYTNTKTHTSWDKWMYINQVDFTCFLRKPLFRSSRRVNDAISQTAHGAHSDDVTLFSWRQQTWRNMPVNLGEISFKHFSLAVGFKLSMS